MKASTRSKRRRIGKDWAANNPMATQLMSKTSKTGAGSLGFVPRGRLVGNPAYSVATVIQQALDPSRAPSKGKSFADMTPEEQAEMRRLYENKP